MRALSFAIWLSYSYCSASASASATATATKNIVQSAIRGSLQRIIAMAV
ncbi:hypothetical protein [Paenibacillus odorifer]|nr:hypothetical protein [Paenibacillus odorifer]